VLTQVKPRQHVLFWVDKLPYRGTFHVNFGFDSDKPNFVALFDSNGRTLIDSMTIPVLPTDVSFGLKEDGLRHVSVKNEAGNKVIADFAQVLSRTTPSTNNILKDQDEVNRRFLEHDPIGAGMSITAMSVVFVALIILYGVFRLIGSHNIKRNKKNALKAQGLSVEKVKESTVVPGEGTAEIYAAIAMAMYLYHNEIHDEESAILTIDKVKRNYSPWNSKIYTLRQTPTVNKK